MGVCLPRPIIDDDNNGGMKQTAEEDEKKTKTTESTINNRRCKPNERVPLGKLTKFGYSTDFLQKYEKGKLLGRGQFGCTYAATDVATGENVAVKMIEKKNMILPIAVEDVKREVKILKVLSGHENIVRFYDAFEDDDYVYIVMELCEGGELLDRILARKDKRYSEKDAAKIVRQMMNVVARCHLHGIVHRDLKPENFLFKDRSEDSPLKATDFGLSDFILPDKKFTDVCGSSYYIAPEVLRRSSGPQADAWSIGVITYVLLCGRRPFWEKTDEAIFKVVLRKDPDFNAKPWPSISMGAKDFVKKLLVKDPDFNAKPWPSISMGAKDFVKKLLVKDPRARMTVAQALSHPWVREDGDATDIPLDISVLSNMRKFVKYSRLKQIFLKALATTLSPDEISDLQDQFNAIDIDKNGTITLEEIRQALAKDQAWVMKESKVLEILCAMDSNRDGLIDFQEFVAATLHVHQLEEHDKKWNQRTRAAFEMFDSDKDGYITPEELSVLSMILLWPAPIIHQSLFPLS